MIALKVRQGVVYAATAVFFLVAALGQIQDAPLAESLYKAAIACGVTTAIGIVLARLVDDGIRKAEEAAKAGANKAEAEPKEGNKGDKKGESATGVQAAESEEAKEAA